MKKANKKNKMKDPAEQDFPFERAKWKPGLGPKQAKVLRSFRIDADIMLWLTQKASEESLSPNTYLNQMLRRQMEGANLLEDRISRIEKAVFKKTS